MMPMQRPPATCKFSLALSLSRSLSLARARSLSDLRDSLGNLDIRAFFVIRRLHWSVRYGLLACCCPILDTLKGLGFGV
jgi:hypothetical protein